jgi:hypothetical protein
MRAIALIGLAGCFGSLADIRGGSAGVSVTAGDVATRGATGAYALELAHGLKYTTELGGGRYPMEDGTHVAGGSFAEIVGLELAALFDAPALARWLELGPEAGLGFIVYRTPDETTPIAGDAYAGGWIDLHIGDADSNVPGVHIEARREVRSELANETVLLLGIVWH